MIHSNFVQFGKLSKCVALGGGDQRLKLFYEISSFFSWTKIPPDDSLVAILDLMALSSA